MIQPVLSSDNSISTDLSVFLNSSESTYEVYIGVALLERIGIDPKILQHKMLVGRLWNAGAKLCDLREFFGHDHRTIKKWGDALKSGDIDVMCQAFAGRSIRKKTTPELIRYVRQLYRSRGMLGRNYREEIINRAREVFGVSISPSLTSELFKGADGISSENGVEPSRDKVEKKATSGHEEPESTSNESSIVQISPIFPFLSANFTNGTGGRTLLRHVGLVFFGLWLRLYNPLQRQLICQILQGAVNIEQAKSLCHHSLRYFCGSTIPGLREQRTELNKEATAANILELYRRNNLLLADGPNHGYLFYFDPHTKEYTGQLKVLKGWCGRRHGVSKVVNLDCFHTQSGRPCFIQHYSPFYDMRERFFMSLSLFDSLFDEDKREGRTFVIDRAIYGLETLKNFEKDYVVTWEKGFDGSGWNDKKTSVSFFRQRRKNSKSDLHTYHFECQESTWSRDEKFRRIIVKVRKDDGREITVSIICSNPDMDIQDIVWAIFNRWLQENDFKYLDVYFGINQLDSRAHDDFAQKADGFRDRPMDSPEYKKLKTLLTNTESRLARNLLTMRRETQKFDALEREEKTISRNIVKQQKKLEALKHNAGTQRQMDNVNSHLKKLAGQHKRICGKIEKSKERTKEIEAKSSTIENEVSELTERLNQQLRKKSRIQIMIDEHYKILDLRKKAYLDAIRVNAANQFRNLHDQFRPICDNFRDDHVRLRMLTRCDGFLVNSNDGVKVQLWLPGSIQAHIIENMREFVRTAQDQINNTTTKVNGARQLIIEILSGPIKS